MRNFKNNGPPCDVNLMTVSLTVVVKSRNPSTVLVLSGPLGSSAKPPDATWMASGSAAAELTETIFQMTATQWQWWKMIAVTRRGAAAAGNVNMGQHQRCQWCKIAWSCGGKLAQNWKCIIYIYYLCYAMSHAFVRTKLIYNIFVRKM